MDNRSTFRFNERFRAGGRGRGWARPEGRGGGGHVGGSLRIDHHNRQSFHNSRPPQPSGAHFSSSRAGGRGWVGRGGGGRGGGGRGDHDVLDKKRRFETHLVHFNPPQKQKNKNARLHSPPHQPSLHPVQWNILDKEGSKLIQEALDEGGSTVATTTLNEGLTLRCWADAMVNRYGHFLFQKLMECITPAERVILVRSISYSKLISAMSNRYGTFSVRKIVDVCAIENKKVSQQEAACNDMIAKILTDALKQHAAVFDLCIDRFGTYVIQLILLKFPYRYTHFIFNAVAARVKDVACHHLGKFVVSYCLDSRNRAARAHLVKRISENSVELMQDPQASVAVKKALDVCEYNEVHSICESVIGNVCLLAIHEIGSHLIRRCLDLCTEWVREQYLCEIIDSGRIRELMNHRIGSYFVQTAMSAFTSAQGIRLVEMMKPHLSSQNFDDQRCRLGIIGQIRRRFPDVSLESGASVTGSLGTGCISISDAGSSSEDHNPVMGGTSISVNSGDVSNDNNGASTSTSRDVPEESFGGGGGGGEDEFLQYLQQEQQLQSETDDVSTSSCCYDKVEEMDSNDMGNKVEEMDSNDKGENDCDTESSTNFESNGDVFKRCCENGDCDDCRAHQQLQKSREEVTDEGDGELSGCADANTNMLDSMTSSIPHKPRSTNTLNRSNASLIAGLKPANDALFGRKQRQPVNRSRATPRNAPNLTRPTTPTDDFWKRRPYSKEKTIERLEQSLQDTDAYLRREVGLVSPNDRYRDDLEKINLEIYGSILEFVLLFHVYIMTERINEDGLFVLRMMHLLGKCVKGGYSISFTLYVVFSKIGSAMGKDGIRGRTMEQMTPGSDPNKYVGVLFLLEEIMNLLESNDEMNKIVDRIYNLLPWTRSYNPYPRERVVNHLAEIACGAILPGQTGLSGESILYMGNPSVYQMVRRPSPRLNASAASMLSNTNRIKVMMTWPRLSTHIADQVTQGVTFDGRRLSDTDREMVKDMLYLNPNFMQQFFTYNYLLGGHHTSVQVDEHVNAVSRSPIDEEIAKLARRVRNALESSEEDIDVLLRDGLGQFWRDDKRSFYRLEQEIAGNPELLARGTAMKLVKWLNDSKTSGEKTVILVERTHQDALKKHQPKIFKSFFGDEKLDECIYCIDKDGNQVAAGHLYSISPKLKILVTGSYFIINSPGQSNETRQNACQQLLAVKEALAQANLVEDSAVEETEQHLQAFMNQITHQISDEWPAIRNNSPEGHNFGMLGREGLQALINIVKKEIDVNGIHHEVIGSFALHLGKDAFQKMLAVVLGHEIDCSNMTNTMLRLKSEQKDQGVMPVSQRQSISLALSGRTGRTHTKESKKKISNANTGHTVTEETKKKLSLARMRLSEEIKAKRNKQYANYRKKNEIPSGILTTTTWKKEPTTWVVNLRKRHFGGEQINVGTFKQLRDATAAMKYVDKKLNSKSKRENEVFVNKVIQHVRTHSKYNAVTLGGKWKRSEKENIL